jgi:hypothetical protein
LWVSWHGIFDNETRKFGTQYASGKKCSVIEEKLHFYCNLLLCVFGPCDLTYSTFQESQKSHKKGNQL